MLLKSRGAERLRRSKLRLIVSRWRERGLAPTDVLIASYPRSGNTWTIFMLAEVLTGSELDFCTHEELVPMVGRHRGAQKLLPRGGRLIKTHEPFRRAYGRAIYLVRDVRDVALSFHKLWAVQGLGHEAFSDFLVRFAQGHVAGYGSWQAHVTSWLTEADRRSDILVVRYEDLVDDTVTKLAEMVRFLGVTVDDARLREIADNNRPAGMRSRKTAFSDERMAMTVGSGTYNNWRARYSDSDLALLEPAMPAMRLAGYPA